MRRLLFASLLLAASCNNEESTTQRSSGTGGGAVTAAEGKALFQANCALCHAIKQDITGPALENVLTAWNQDTAALRAFIRNPSKAIFEDKVPRAIATYEKFKPTVMTAFPALTDQELNAIIAYIHQPSSL